MNSIEIGKYRHLARLRKKAEEKKIRHPLYSQKKWHFTVRMSKYHVTTLHYHLQVQANSKKMVQKNRCYF